MKKILIIICLLLLIIFLTFFWRFGNTQNYDSNVIVGALVEKVEEIKPEPRLDKKEYDRLSEYVANNPPPKYVEVATTTEIKTATTTITEISTTTVELKEDYLYPVKDAPYPKYGAILPFNRIIAYYGNFYSERMGILGEFSEEKVLERLQKEIDNWNNADSEIPALPAVHYIASTAQANPGEEGLYTLRMPDEQIERAVNMAEKIDGIVFLDLQVGLSTIQKELPFIEEYLKLPKVHLGIDPEFSMKTGDKPGTVIGHYTDEDINFVIDYLSEIVKENNLPPKVLVIHRFTHKMVRNYQNIKPTPEVQIVVHMDGWGSPARKFNTYDYVVSPEPIQFTGFKIFYKNDLKEEPHRLLTPEELLKLRPNPIYIQYQ